MGRGTELAEGIKLAETSPAGVTTTVHFQGTEMIIERSQDMKEALEYVKQRRQELEGMNWGAGREVGYIPELFYSKIREIPDAGDRKKAVKEFFRRNPAFCYFPKYLKV